jgi:XTP/dITP diphosphohydrolase
VRIVLATWNPDKIQWLSKGFEDLNLPIEAVDPARFAGCEEDGETCAENAGKKAMSVGAIDGAIVVAEDSGLCCDGLGGFPGTHTARWAPGSDDSRAALLLEKLRGVRDRRARFLSAICLVFPDGETALCEGTLEGTIAVRAKGNPKAGYGAIFELECGETIAEIGPRRVDAYNHRQKAMRAACGEIRKWMRHHENAGAPTPHA